MKKIFTKRVCQNSKIFYITNMSCEDIDEKLYPLYDSLKTDGLNYSSLEYDSSIVLNVLDNDVKFTEIFIEHDECELHNVGILTFKDFNVEPVDCRSFDLIAFAHYLNNTGHGNESINVIFKK